MEITIIISFGIEIEVGMEIVIVEERMTISIRVAFMLHLGAVILI